MVSYEQSFQIFLELTVLLDSYSGYKFHMHLYASAVYP